MIQPKQSALLAGARNCRKQLGSLKRLLLRASDTTGRRLASAEKVFTDVYCGRKWGAGTQEDDFNSGLGSGACQGVAAYISTIKALATQVDLAGKVFVDIGCGDFRIGRQLTDLAGLYIGVDVVKPLIERNRRLFSEQKIRFVQLDATREPLPAGDVCFLRQVLQHLSNRQIAAILQKLGQYKWVVITEHLPADEHLVQPNLDKTHGADIRVYRNSGVYLDQPPFDIPKQRLSLLLEVPGTDLGPGIHPGVIRTHLYEPTKSLI
jgi:SAM-dependent methyltransferase